MSELRPSISVTSSRLLAAKAVSIAASLPSSKAMAAALLDQTEAEQRPDERLRWAVLTGNDRQAETAIGELVVLCDVKTPVERQQTCKNLRESMWAFIAVTAPRLTKEFTNRLGSFPKPACPGTRLTASELLGSVVCGAGSPSSKEWRSAIQRIKSAPPAQRDDRSLWGIAAVGRFYGLRMDEIRPIVESSLADDRVSGFYVDKVPTAGSLIATWGLLHVVAPGLSGIDKVALSRAIESGITSSSASDHLVLAAAAQHLMSQPVGSPPAQISLGDPRGPYNVFVALAAQDAGVRILLTYSPDSVGADPEAVAQDMAVSSDRVHRAP